ncbi:hypothetical protein BDV95DRAFT_608061 [Massariosphaeria phaeospora]|uniref:Gfd2/YDR514C-like C-terminal domain-containing protein n=1 Tax=Massariosphaeria phaeospora TaxID=100035 RepID=A0A7C8M6B4_9PLEO|nr:hypothetical protein BDV95DRAFT_608061 [Massariosphaeria phaeospora]
MSESDRSSPSLECPSFDSLREKLAELSGTQILKAALETTGAVLTAASVRTSRTDPNRITEIALATLNPSDIRDMDPGVRGENWLKEIMSYHLLLIENAHLLDESQTSSDFSFGKTRWVTMRQAERYLEEVFLVDNLETPGEYHPVILIPYGSAAQIHQTTSILATELECFGTHVATVKPSDVSSDTIFRMVFPNGNYTDTTRQSHALELSTHFANALHTFGSNSANHATITLRNCIILALLSKQLAWTSHQLQALPAELSRTLVRVQRAVEDFEPAFGFAKFCARCESHKHDRAECKAKVQCLRCKRAGASAEVFESHSHARCELVDSEEWTARGEVSGNVKGWLNTGEYGGRSS